VAQRHPDLPDSFEDQQSDEVIRRVIDRDLVCVLEYVEARTSLALASGAGSASGSAPDPRTPHAIADRRCCSC